MKVTVIVCAYTERRWDDLVKSAASIQNQSRKLDEFILVIDHNPALFQRAKKEFLGIHVIENKYDRGLSGARNSAIEVASGDALAFMDEDAVADSQWLSRLLPAFEDSSVMGVGGTIQPGWDAGRPSWFPREFDWVVGCTYQGLPEVAAPVRNLIGCNMAFRREVFSTVGGFQVGMGRVGTLPLGCEETELCIRARQHWPERSFLYEPSATVLHRVPVERANARYFFSRCYSEGISKAAVSRLVGSSDGLSSEWRHTLVTLPRGVWRGLVRLATKFQIAGFCEAAAIIAGLFVTTVGYLVGWF
ncbi:MAG: glycosyltransferase family 2 protein, partial [Chloroflexi bacterium]|nr:glycosyltransferase family 2 protein [Chloroflexota bacterium]